MISHVPLQHIKHPLLQRQDITLSILREDLRLPQASGNKWHKLKYNLDALQSQGFQRVLSFGGIWSNHIHALASIASQYQLDTIAMIRGEEQRQTAMLEDVMALGMQIHYVSRQVYKQRHDLSYQQQLAITFDAALLPEGGTNSLAVKGCADISIELQQRTHFDYICCPVGSGGTIAGIASALTADQRAIGYLIVKDNSLEQKIGKLVDQVSFNKITLKSTSPQAYAKVTTDLINFIAFWEQQFNIPIEPVYSGKMLKQLWLDIEQGLFPRGSRIIAVHTGGMQGKRGFIETYPNIYNTTEP